MRFAVTLAALLLAASAADLALARDRGVTTVISLRRDSEPVGYDERAEARMIGLVTPAYEEKARAYVERQRAPGQ